MTSFIPDGTAPGFGAAVSRVRLAAGGAGWSLGVGRDHAARRLSLLFSRSDSLTHLEDRNLPLALAAAAAPRTHIRTGRRDVRLNSFNESATPVPHPVTSLRCRRMCGVRYSYAYFCASAVVAAEVAIV